MFSPGATTSTHLPKLENVDTTSPGPTEPTAIAPGAAAGYIVRSLPSLPAAATTSTPAAVTACTASRSALEDPWLPRLMLITFAPCRAAQYIPSAAAHVVPEPSSSRIRTGIILADGAT